MIFRNFIPALTSVVFFIGCGGSVSSALDEDITHDKLTKQSIDIYSISSKEVKTSLDILNSYRQSAGLIAYSSNNILSNVAQSHANYLIKNNLYTHDEDGKNPSVRALDAGYDHTDTSENIYAGNISPKGSIDILFANIFHRLAFLDFGFDEIGFGLGGSKSYAFAKVYTYEMGRENSRKSNYDKNPSIVLYPYKNQKNVLPVFYEESPDPLPECSVSGYPISVQFNPVKSEDIDLISLKLYKGSQELTDVKLLNSDLLSAKEFVLMPLSRLKWGTTYAVKANYKEDEISKTIKWNFTTKSLPKPHFFVKKDLESFDVKSGQVYYFYMPPKDCNDRFETYHYKCSAGVRIDIKMTDNNTLMIKATGQGSVEIDTDNGKSFNLVVG